MLCDNEFRRLLDFFDRPWSGFRKVRKGVKKRIRRHMHSLGITTLERYLDYLAQHPQARATCEQCLTVTISRFYRDRRLWDHLAGITLPALMGAFPDGLRFWSAGCANGEEPYTLAMVWKRLVRNLHAVPPMKIVATDISSTCLRRAEQGIFGRSSLKEVPLDDLRHSFFKLSGGRQWQIQGDLKASITWRQHQLLDRPLPGFFHLILLRNNLLTYYQGDRMRLALEQIVNRLVPGGGLVIGSHEWLPSLPLPLNRDACNPQIYWR